MSIIPRKIRPIVSPMFKPISVLTLVASVALADVALARTTNINLPVTTQRGESYQQFLTRASKLAGETIERRFQQNKDIDRVNLLVTAQHGGDISPLLSVNVSRQDWKGNPNAQSWARVFPFGKDLLGFGGGSASPSSPPPPPSVTPDTAASPPSPTGNLPPGNSPNGKTPPAGTNAPIVPPFAIDPLAEPSTPRPLPDQRLMPRGNTVP